jgi:hypothetical protein
MMLHEVRRTVEDGKPKPTKVYAMSSVQHLVQRLRKLAKLPPTFTLDACRHGGMTELEEAVLTDGQGRALSAHKKAMRSEPWSVRSPLPGNATRIGWRTTPEQSFRMAAEKRFRMAVKNKPR